MVYYVSIVPSYVPTHSCSQIFISVPIVGLSQCSKKFTDHSIPDFHIILPIIPAYLTYYSLIIPVVILYQNSN